MQGVDPGKGKGITPFRIAVGGYADAGDFGSRRLFCLEYSQRCTGDAGYDACIRRSKA